MTDLTSIKSSTECKVVGTCPEGWILSTGETIFRSTVNKQLRPELIEPGTSNELRIGSSVKIVRNNKGRVYLDLGECYQESQHRLIESRVTEVKSSLNICAGKEEPQDSNPRQWMVLASVLVSFANAGIEDGKLIVGYHDNGVLKGLNDEIHDDREAVEFEVKYKNFIYQITQSRLFAANLLFEWTMIRGRRILTITVPKWPGELLLLGTQLYIRDAASTVLLKFNDAIRYIRHYQANS